MRFDSLVEHTGDLWLYGAVYPRQQPGKKKERGYRAKGIYTEKSTAWSGLYLGFVVRGRSPEWAKGVQVHDPRKCFESNMKYALRCNLVHFETILRNVTVCALTLSRLDDFSDIVTHILR